MTNEPKEKSFADLHPSNRTIAEPNDRQFIGADYVALTKTAHEVVDEFLMKSLEEDPREKKAFDDNSVLITRRLMAPFEQTIWGMTTDTFRLPANDHLLLGESLLPAENFQELKKRLNTMLPAVATHVSDAASFSNWGKFSTADEDVLHAVYEELKDRMLEEIEIYKRDTAHGKSARGGLG